MKVTPEADGLHLVGGLLSKKEKVVPWSWLAVVRDEGGPLSSLRMFYVDPADPGDKKEIEPPRGEIAGILGHSSFPRELVLPATAKRFGLEPGRVEGYGPPLGTPWLAGPKVGLGRNSPDDQLVALVLKSFPKVLQGGFIGTTDVAPFDRGVAFQNGSDNNEVARWEAISPSRLPAPNCVYWISLFGPADTDEMYGFALTLDQARALVSHPSAAVWDLPDTVYSVLNASRPEKPLRSG
ncbi:MAG: hypothetical protein KGJ23_05095 [Euryarchaeota archaeon]|nr:hypothetical protein [Euryarchaeota archaeon]MDE1835975.1 hypothetical protein [Euryarchaeota archaeon]MDE1882068.1 hypothetical protein [Euryarchaeota archaeon]MDE2044346.1 hypothetical protein [Thermoplasmata archaeon]